MRQAIHYTLAALAGLVDRCIYLDKFRRSLLVALAVFFPTDALMGLRIVFANQLF